MSERRTYILLRYQPRAWVEELYEEILRLVLPRATHGIVTPRGYADYDVAPALVALRARSPDGGDVTLRLDDADDARLFRDAAPATLRARAFTADERAPLFSTGKTANEMSVALTGDERSALEAWVEAHGDEFELVFRRDDALAKKRPPIGVRLNPGEQATVDAYELSQELRRTWIDAGTVRRSGESVLVDARVERLIPDSGLLGRMGRYVCIIEIPDAGAYAVDDDQELGAVLVEDAHYDPACRRLHIGHPAFGSVTVTTGADRYRLTVADRPVQVRRWMRWRAA